MALDKAVYPANADGYQGEGFSRVVNFQFVDIMKKKIKVLFYLQNLGGGGAERSIVELFKNYNRNEFEFKLLLKNNDKDEYSQILTESDFIDPGLILNNLSPLSISTFCSRPYLGVRVDSFFYNKIEKLYLSLIILAMPLFSFKGIKKAVNVYGSAVRYYASNKDKTSALAAVIEDFKPDIVVGSLIETSNALLLFLKVFYSRIFRGAKWVAIEQNNTFKRFLEYYPNQPELDFWNFITRLIFKSADKIIAVSNGVKQGISKYYDEVPSKIAVIHNQANLDSIGEFDPKILKRKFILTAGRLHPQKNFDSLIRVYARISSQIEEDLIILGSGRQKEKLVSLSNEFGLGDRIKFPGFSSDIWAYMKSAQCFVLSSKFEGLPLVVLEAMACECPVIAFDCDYGPSEIISNGRNGVLVKNGDINALSDAILRVLSDVKLREKLISGGRKRVKRFSADTIARKYEEAFSIILDE